MKSGARDKLNFTEMIQRDVIYDILALAGKEWNWHNRYKLYEEENLDCIATIVGGAIKAMGYKIVPMSSDESFNTVDDNGE